MQLSLTPRPMPRWPLGSCCGASGVSGDPDYPPNEGPNLGFRSIDTDSVNDFAGDLWQAAASGGSTEVSHLSPQGVSKRSECRRSLECGQARPLDFPPAQVSLYRV